MSPHIMAELSDTRISARKFEKGHKQFERELTNLMVYVYGSQNNERHLVSRNKREGWYYDKYKSTFHRSEKKDIALRYRRQSGAIYFKLRNRTKVISKTRSVNDSA